MDPEGVNDGSFTMKSFMFQSGVDEAVREETGSETLPMKAGGHLQVSRRS